MMRIIRITHNFIVLQPGHLNTFLRCRNGNWVQDDRVVTNLSALPYGGTIERWMLDAADEHDRTGYHPACILCQDERR